MRRFLVAAVVALASLALAAPASATTVEISVTCTEATFSYSRFPTNIESSALQTVTVDGQQVYSATIQFPGPAFVSMVPLSITGDATVTATSAWTAHQSGTASTTANVQCGGGTTTGGDTTGGDTTGGDTTGGDTTGGDTTGGDTTGGDTTGGDTTGGDTTTGGGTTGGGTTGTGGVSVGTTGGSGDTGGELPFTGLPVWIPLLLAGALLASGTFLLRRRRDDVS
ncbi:MAG TPA: hypothetical protein VD769_12575 [Gaiellaceae bacterium]|nr:hypothetical protein [Gaiellaceae bacterium]